MIRTKGVGYVTLQEVLDHFRALEQDPECPKRSCVFLDLSGVVSLPETPQISTVVLELKRIQHKVQFDACAILVSADALFGMMRVFEALAEELFRATRTFRISAEAEAWLAALQPPVQDNPPKAS